MRETSSEIVVKRAVGVVLFRLVFGLILLGVFAICVLTIDPSDSELPMTSVYRVVAYLAVPYVLLVMIAPVWTVIARRPAARISDGNVLIFGPVRTRTIPIREIRSVDGPEVTLPAGGTQLSFVAPKWLAQRVEPMHGRKLALNRFSDSSVSVVGDYHDKGIDELASFLRSSVGQPRVTDVSAPREVYADFGNADPQGRVRLNTYRSIADLEKLGSELGDGLSVTLVSEDLTCPGTLEWSPEELIWVARIDWIAVDERSIG